MLVSALAFIIEATLIVAVVNIFNLTTYKDRLDQAVRAYVLVLETKGELNKQSVADGLTADGFSVNASDIVINDGKAERPIMVIQYPLELNMMLQEMKLVFRICFK